MKDESKGKAKPWYPGYCDTSEEKSNWSPAKKSFSCLNDKSYLKGFRGWEGQMGEFHGI